MQVARQIFALFALQDVGQSATWRLISYGPRVDLNDVCREQYGTQILGGMEREIRLVEMCAL